MTSLEFGVTNFQHNKDKGSYEIHVKSQAGCFLMVCKISLVTNVAIISIAHNYRLQLLHVHKKICDLEGIISTYQTLEDYKFDTYELPQHRLLYDTCNQASIGPTFESFGRHANLHKIGTRYFQSIGGRVVSGTLEALAFWRNTYKLDSMQIIVQIDFFDLRPSESLQGHNKRTWAIERTIARKMAREQHMRVGIYEKRYKGVRWRPERKHPWVAEIKLPKSRKKMWIGNYKTAKEAVEAYNAIAFIHRDDQLNLNVCDAHRFALESHTTRCVEDKHLGEQRMIQNMWNANQKVCDSRFILELCISKILLVE